MAWGLDDILKLLDRWGEWKKMREAPVLVDALEKRVAVLEEKLGGKWPADVCQFCGERALRQTFVGGPNDKGNMFHEWTCQACNQVEKRLKKPS